MSSRIKIIFWVGLTLTIFSLFRWLFGIAIPEIALEFSIGITVILVGGLLAGRYVSRVWFNADKRFQSRMLLILGLAIFLSLIGIGVLVNMMILETEFIHFSFTIMLLFLASACMGALITLIRHRIKNKILSAQTAMAHSKSELQLLQSQLSPHFLFNTLNNLYGLSICDHEKVPTLLLKLSELLRYSVYEAKEIFVPLQYELDYMKNYIEFEKIRLADRLDLTLNLQQSTDKSLRIPPMLLIVFVENAFKHGRSTQAEKIFINIALSITEDEIVFSVTNSCFRSSLESQLINKHSGFGLESVRKRLDLLYEDSHDLKIKESPTEYYAELILKYR